MKPNILTKTIAALLLALPFAQAEEKKAVEKKEEHTDGTLSLIHISEPTRPY